MNLKIHGRVFKRTNHINQKELINCLTLKEFKVGGITYKILQNSDEYLLTTKAKFNDEEVNAIISKIVVEDDSIVSIESSRDSKEVLYSKLLIVEVLSYMKTLKIPYSIYVDNKKLFYQLSIHREVVALVNTEKAILYTKEVTGSILPSSEDTITLKSK